MGAVMPPAARLVGLWVGGVVDEVVGVDVGGDGDDVLQVAQPGLGRRLHQGCVVAAVRVIGGRDEYYAAAGLQDADGRGREHR